MRILMLVLNDIRRDKRVQRAYSALAEQHDVRLLFLDETDSDANLEPGYVPVRLNSKQWSNHPAVQVVKYIEFIARVVWVALRWKPDLLYCHDIDTLPVASVLRMKRLPFVYDSHEYWRGTMNLQQRNGILYRLLLKLEKRLMPKAAGVVTVNREIGKLLSEEHHVPMPVIIRNIPSEAMDATSSDVIRRAVTLPHDAKVVLYMGGFSNGRGLEKLVQSVRLWDEHNHLIMLGFGSLEQKLKGIAGSCGATHRVHFVKPVPSSEVPLWAAAADVGIIPYENTCPNHYFALPNKLFDFALVKRPIVGSNFPVIRRYIEEYGLGSTMDTSDEASIAAAVNDIVRSEHAISEENWRRFLHDCAWEDEKKKLQTLINGSSTGKRSSQARVCHVTTVHVVTDTRILWRECASAARRYHVLLLAPHSREEKLGGVTIVPMKRYTKRLKRMTWGAWRAFCMAMRIKADLYHFHDPELLPWMALLGAFKRKPVVYDVHEMVLDSFVSRDYMGGFTKRLASGLYSALERICLRRMQAVVAASEHICQDVQARVSQAKAITVVQNYPRLEQWALATEDSKPRTRSVVYVGRISKERGIHHLVDAMQFVDGTLHLAGDYEDERFHTELKSLPGWAKVQEHGYLSRQQVAQLMAEAGVGAIVLPPAPNHEAGHPNKLFEYMAAGLPVVASDFPLWREFVADNGCGVMVDPLDPKAIAAGINWLLDHPEEARRMGGTGKRLVQEKFNWSHEEEKLLALYEQLLEKR